MIQPAITPPRQFVLALSATDLFFMVLLKFSLFMDELESFDREAKAMRRKIGRTTLRYHESKVLLNNQAFDTY